jgi:hypothetical protein
VKISPQALQAERLALREGLGTQFKGLATALYSEHPESFRICIPLKDPPREEKDLEEIEEREEKVEEAVATELKEEEAEIALLVSSGGVLQMEFTQVDLLGTELHGDSSRLIPFFLLLLLLFFVLVLFFFVSDASQSLHVEKKSKELFHERAFSLLLCACFVPLEVGCMVGLFETESSVSAMGEGGKEFPFGKVWRWWF